MRQSLSTTRTSANVKAPLASESKLSDCGKLRSAVVSDAHDPPMSVTLTTLRKILLPVQRRMQFSLHGPFG